MHLQTFLSAQEFTRASVTFIEEICHDTDTHIRLALSGGKKIGSIYQTFATRGQLHDKTRIAFYQVDERYVPQDHPDSNWKLIEDTFIAPFTQKKQISPLTKGYFFQTDLSIEKSLKRYEKMIQETIQIHGFPFHLAIMGMGPDGHTASLFPHSPALHEDKRLVAHTTTDQFAVHDRLTLTFPAILTSKRLLLLLQGPEKKAILDHLLHSSKSVDDLPAKKLLEHPDLTIYFCPET